MQRKKKQAHEAEDGAASAKGYEETEGKRNDE